jgi:hypothetical protein
VHQVHARTNKAGVKQDNSLSYHDHELRILQPFRILHLHPCLKRSDLFEERGREFEDHAKKRLRLFARMRRRAISSSAINSIAVVAASLDQRPPLSSQYFAFILA